MGSGEFGLPALDHLLTRDDVDLTVVTQPDRPAGRGRSLQATPVARKMTDGRAPLLKIARVNDAESLAQLQALEMDLLIVCDFGQILNPELLRLPRVGPFNLHGSVLPAYRGAAPVQRAILDGASSTGVTVIRMDEGCDTGPIVSMASTDVGADEDFGSLHARLSAMTVPLLADLLDLCAAGHPPQGRPQDHSKSTIAPKVRKEEQRLAFDRPATEVVRRIRAFAPSPGAYAMWKGTRIKFLHARPWPQTPPEPGVVRLSSDGNTLLVGCASSTALVVERLQGEGGRPMGAREWINGRADFDGAKLD